MSFAPKCLCLDIETAADDALDVRKIAAWRPDTHGQVVVPNVANMIGNAAMLIDRSVKNEARRKVAKLAQMEGGGKFMVKIEPSEKQVKIAGDQVIEAILKKMGIPLNGDAPAFFEFLVHGHLLRVFPRTALCMAKVEGFGAVVILYRSALVLAERIAFLTGGEVELIEDASLPKMAAPVRVVEMFKRPAADERLERLKALAGQDPPAHDCALRRDILAAQAELERAA